MNIDGLLYELKKQFGVGIDYVQILESNVDDVSGERDIRRVTYCLPAILLPEDRAAKFIQDIGYLAANKNFTYGALNDFNSTKLLVAKEDIPEGLQISLQGYVNKGPRRYEKVSFESLLDAAYLLVVRGVEGSLPFSQVRQRVESKLRIGGRVTYELN